MTATYKARDILNMTKHDVWHIPNGEMEVVFDDGESLVTTTRRTIFSYYLWSLHRQFPNLPILKRHHVGNIELSSKLYLKTLSTIYRDWYERHPDVNPEPVWREIYLISNSIYNEFIQALDRYVVSLNILDFIEVLDQPKLLEAKAKLKPTQASIDGLYDVLKEILFDDDSLNGNPIQLAARSFLVDIKQINQCLAARGFTTEIESTIFPHPITSSFVDGMRNIYDSLIDSRSAAKALFYTKEPLQDCEYFNRKLQLLGQFVMRLYPGDCGSPHTLPWKIEASELKIMEGIKYLEDNQLKTVHSSDRHLIGKTLQLRTPFGCRHNDPQGICTTCHGDMSHSIPYGTAPGHEAAVAICEKISQLVLSTKHVEGSSKVDDVDLGEFYSQYLVPGADNNTLKLNPSLIDQKIKISVAQAYMRGLPMLEVMNDLGEVRVGAISEIKEITMYIGEDDEMHEMIVPVAMGSRLASFTRSALSYIKDHPITISDDGNYIIDLDQWDPNVTLFELPMKHLNMLDFQSQVERVILSKDGLPSFTKRDPNDKSAQVEAIKSLVALLNSKLSINISHVMTICYAAAAIDPKSSDFRLPKAGEPFRFAVYNELMQGRSVGSAMAYQEQEQPIIKPETYIIKDRPAHPIDAMLMGDFTEPRDPSKI